MTTMKGTEHFKQAIKSYLDGRAKTDELFAVAYAKENKNLDDCITFILNQVKAMANEGCVGMADDDMYSLACHFYDEDMTDIGKPVNCKVIVNNRIELTEEEKAEARQRAISQYQAEELRKMQQRKSKSAEKPQEAKQTEPNLFGF